MNSKKHIIVKIIEKFFNSKVFSEKENFILVTKNSGYIKKKLNKMRNKIINLLFGATLYLSS